MVTPRDERTGLLSLSDLDEVEATCGKCGAETTVNELALHGQTVWNRNHDDKLSITDIAICDACHTKWQTERADYQARYSQRWLEGWRMYKATAKERGIEYATALLPPALREEREFVAMKQRWDTWWRDQGSKGKGKGDSF